MARFVVQETDLDLIYIAKMLGALDFITYMYTTTVVYMFLRQLITPDESVNMSYG